MRQSVGAERSLAVFTKPTHQQDSLLILIGARVSVASSRLSWSCWVRSDGRKASHITGLGFSFWVFAWGKACLPVFTCEGADEGGACIRD